MRRFWFSMLVVTVSVTATHAQNALTSDQRVADLNQLASLYAKNYAPYEWKRDTFGFDLLNLKPWLRRDPARRRSRFSGSPDRIRRVAERCARLYRVSHDVQRVASD